MNFDERDELERACSGNASASEEDFENAVGHRQPPKQHRWTKGMPSPNRGGRPRKKTSKRHFLQTIGGRLVTIKVDGRAQQVTTLEAIITVARLKAIKGHQAASHLVDWLKGVVHDEALEQVPKNVLFTRGKMTSEEWEATAAAYRDRDVAPEQRTTADLSSDAA